jgi:hypothetical protein
LPINYFVDAEVEVVRDLPTKCPGLSLTLGYRTFAMRKPSHCPKSLSLDSRHMVEQPEPLQRKESKAGGGQGQTMHSLRTVLLATEGPASQRALGRTLNSDSPTFPKPYLFQTSTLGPQFRETRVLDVHSCLHCLIHRPRRQAR